MASETQQQLHTAAQLLKAGRRAEALALLKRIIAAERSNVTAWWLAAQAESDPNEVRAALRVVLRLRPDHGGAQAMLARLESAPSHADRKKESAVSTLVIVNPHAASGRALRAWSQIEPLLWAALGDMVVAVTQRADEVARHLDEAIVLGLKQVIVIGGDGTNHTVINALAERALAHPDRPCPAFGSLPIGTGRDWARAVGTPLNPKAAVEWLARARPRPVDLGQLTHNGGTSYFLNVASAGISGDIAARVNAARRRHPWTFLAQTVNALLRYRPRRLRVWLDGERWYEGTAFVVAVANGRMFGHGMLIAPEARIDDGLFDVVLAEGMARLTALQALPSLYKGTHLLRQDVHHARAAQVDIEAPEGPLDMELDGEYAVGEDIHLAIRAGLLQMLNVPPQEEAAPS